MSGKKRRITVLLADDHTLVREGLRTMLKFDDDVEVVGEAKTGREAVELADRLRPDVVVMDLDMPLLNGMEATRRIHAALPEIRILILSAHSSGDHFKNVMAAGAAGYMLKETSVIDLSLAIRSILEGKTFFSPSMARFLSSENPAAPAGRSLLSSREIEVLQLIAEGHSNKQIASGLAISIKTVETHRQHVMKKLDIHDTAGLTRYAMEAGIIKATPLLAID